MYYNKNLEKTRDEIGREFDNEIRILAEKYDMTDVDEYKDELEKLLNEEKYSPIKAFRLYVVDMEDGNTSTSSKGLNSDTVYEKELKVEDEKANTSYLGYNGKDFLDKNGNIVNPDIFSEYFFYNESNILSKALVAVGAVLLIGYFIIRSKEK